MKSIDDLKLSLIQLKHQLPGPDPNVYKDVVIKVLTDLQAEKIVRRIKSRFESLEVEEIQKATALVYKWEELEDNIDPYTMNLEKPIIPDIAAIKPLRKPRKR